MSNTSLNEMETIVTLHARVTGLNDQPPSMTIHIKGAIWPCDVLRLPAQDGVKIGDSFVVVLSKVKTEQEQPA